MEEKTFRMKHFTPGKRVVYNNSEYIVDHVTIKEYEVFVHLQGIPTAVHADLVWCEPTVFLLERQ